MMKVLVADDEPKVRLLVNATLNTAGGQYAVIEATNGDEALSMIQRHRPVVALLDVGMPGRTGLQVTRAVKDDPDLADTRVILITARAQQSDIQAGLRAGADLYITKPFSPKELLTAINQTTR